jgi:galactofuranosylgalactofuranosylrhamnosyl-N-acetylglucosaminyl-diphospho-decaprenol beta-1,5/1,6-galactofuranosyltransferase
VTTRTLHRVVFPHNPDIDVMPLYWDVDQASFAAPRDDDVQTRRVHVAVGTLNLDLLLDRRRYVVEAGTRASTATYFNAFPASYWRRWTRVEDVVLRVGLRGDGRIAVYRSTDDGRIQRVKTAMIDSGETGEIVEMEFSLSLAAFGDGGWYWFDIIAGHDDVLLEFAEYMAEVGADDQHGTVAISITTFNRPDWCAALLLQIADGLEEMDGIAEVLVVDQGNQRVSEHPAFSEAKKGLGDRLRVIAQPNLGGSGGFARGQLEVSESGKHDYVLLLDDDVQIEPEGVRRAVVFADLCRRPTIVGGHMFSVYSRASLHSFGETVNRWRFWWGAAARVWPDHDFAVESLRSTPWLHRRVDVDYNGWWMCLIPVEVIKTIGLSLPVFIKWDDAEYGLRAGEAGFPTVSLPGAAVWHVPWSDKDDALDWQAYYHQRNRLVAALLHSPYERGGRLVQESFNHQIKHILSMQYSTAELRLRALEDVLSGPGHLHAQLPTTLAEVRELRATFTDARSEKDPDAFPPPRRRKPPKRGKDPTEPRSVVGKALAAVSGVVRQARGISPEALERPEMRVAARDSRWWVLSGIDSAIVSTLDGTAASLYQRDRATAVDLMSRSMRAHSALAAVWPQLAKTYRAALPTITGAEEWKRTLGIGER